MYAAAVRRDDSRMRDHLRVEKQERMVRSRSHVETPSAQARVLLVCTYFALVFGCGGTGEPSEILQSAQQSAATTTTNGISSVFPLVDTLPAEFAAQSAAFAVHSDHLDAVCATLPIDPLLTPYRPNGTGCPRATLPEVLP